MPWDGQIASYWIVATPSTLLSLDVSWFGAENCWFAELDVDYGQPLGPALRTGPFTWARNLTRSLVSIDVAAGGGGTGTVYLLP